MINWFSNITFHNAATLSAEVHETILETITAAGRMTREGETWQRERETVTAKEKTKTKGSVSERKESIKPGRRLLAAAS